MIDVARIDPSSLIQEPPGHRLPPSRLEAATVRR
jgi:hypothetical protein